MILITILAAALCTSAFGGCDTGLNKGPLDVRKVSYLVSSQQTGHDEFYIITADHKVTQYSIDPDDGRSYDYFAGEMPSESKYKVTEYEIDELDWTSIVNVLTRVDFMNILDEFPPLEKEDGASYYIQVETPDGIHKSGGYEAGFRKDPENRRFSEAKQQIEHALKNADKPDT